MRKTGKTAFIMMRAHNVSKYINRAIDSILMQDYPNIQVVVLDDGSTDNTAEIVKAYNNENIQYFYQENLGPAGAFRSIVSKVLAMASPEDYIFALDADDFYISETAVSSTVERMENLDANLCIIGMEFSGDSQFILQADAGAKHNGVVNKLGEMNEAVNIETAPFIIDADTTLWSKVYRKDMLERYISMLPEFAADLKVCEDFPATVTLLMKDAKVTANPVIFYGFYKRSDSITSKPTVANFERDRIQFIKITQQVVDENPGEFFAVAQDFVNTFVQTKYNIISGIVENKVKAGDLPSSYSKEKWQETFRREVKCNFLD